MGSLLQFPFPVSILAVLLHMVDVEVLVLFLTSLNPLYFFYLGFFALQFPGCSGCSGCSGISLSSVTCCSGFVVSPLMFCGVLSFSLTVSKLVIVSSRPHVDVNKLGRNTKVVAEALARVIYNLTEKV